MKTKPLISVIIPAHNEAGYLARCIRSVRKASKKIEEPVEIIVVCNRYTDSTAEIAAACKARVLTDDTRSIASVRNTGIHQKGGRDVGDGGD